MTNAHYLELLTLLRGIKGMAMISGYASALYDDFLHDWTWLSRTHYAAAGAKKRTEILWISPRAAEALKTSNNPNGI